MAVWVMKLNPEGGENPFEFCLRQKIVGFGWGVEGEPKTPQELKELYEAQKPCFNERGFITAINAFVRMKKDDIIWTVDKYGTYYLCQTNGEFHCDYTGEYIKSHIVHYMACPVFYKIGTGELVPNAIIHSLGVCGTIQAVENEEAIKLSHHFLVYIKELEKEKEA